MRISFYFNQREVLGLGSIIEVKKLKKSFVRKGGKPINAVDDISFSVQEGEIFGLLGPNGAGKSSVIRMMCGLLTPEQGDIRICGHQVKNNRRKSLRHISAVLEGNRNLYWRMTVKENIAYFVGNRGYSYRQIQSDVDRLMKQFKIEHKEDELVGNLSRGMQQKLAILISLAIGTEAILLDEPTLGLDVETTEELKRILVQICMDFKKTIIVSTHDMKLVEEICDRVVIVNQGKKVVEDSVENLLDLFRTKTYQMRVKGGKISEEVFDRIQSRFPWVRFDAENGVYLVNIKEGEMFFPLMEVLKEESVSIESIETVTVDFERVYTTLCERNFKDVIHV